jgi:mannose-6-phosphate isomerase-like protein (cupin superfamily)
MPLGTRFQFRCLGSGLLAAVAVTMPPWPSVDQAVVIEGVWEPTV